MFLLFHKFFSALYFRIIKIKKIILNFEIFLSTKIVASIIIITLISKRINIINFRIIMTTSSQLQEKQFFHL